jgi:dipeptidyl aminopeptidase/acylaminoacyl peptidase
VLQVFQKRIGSPSRVQVTHGGFDCQDPFWSPDGTRLYYVSLARDRDGLWSISAAGGEPEIVMENVSSAALSPDGRTLAFLRNAEEGWGPEAVRVLAAGFAAGSASTGFVRAGRHDSRDDPLLARWFQAWRLGDGGPSGILGVAVRRIDALQRASAGLRSP